jgi:hypothetical protein
MPLGPLVRPPGQNCNNSFWTGPPRPTRSLTVDLTLTLAQATMSPSPCRCGQLWRRLSYESIRLAPLYTSIQEFPLIASVGARTDPWMDLGLRWLHGGNKVEAIWMTDHIDLAKRHWKNKCLIVSAWFLNTLLTSMPIPFCKIIFR